MMENKEHITYTVVDTKTTKTYKTTTSAIEAKREMNKGRRIEVWIKNECVAKRYERNIQEFNQYIKREKEFIAQKQAIAHEKKQARRARAAERASAGSTPCRRSTMNIRRSK